MRNYLLTLINVFMLSSVFCQQPIAEKSPDVVQIESLINTFFSAMSKGDSSAISSICQENIVLGTTFTARNGDPVFLEDNFSEFLSAVATPRKETWDERISGLNIQMHENLAQAWMYYSFYLDNTFSHCGVNAFTFVKTKSGWQIQSIIDTRSKEVCN